MMTWPLLQILTVIYLVIMTLLQRRGWQLSFYIWSAFGFTFLFIHLALLQNWHGQVASIEAYHVEQIGHLFGIDIQRMETATLLIPDNTGWSGLRIGVESSTLIELSVFTGLLLFYPKLTLRGRLIYLSVGIVGTYVLNLLRLLLIIVMILIWGKPIVPLAHTVVGRIFYFVGVVTLYWYLFTKPTLHIARRFIETSGRAEH